MLMASGANYGLRRTLPHMLGISLGHMVMVFAVGVFLLRVFSQFPALNLALKILSVTYMGDHGLHTCRTWHHWGRGTCRGHFCRRQFPDDCPLGVDRRSGSPVFGHASTAQDIQYHDGPTLTRVALSDIALKRHVVCLCRIHDKTRDNML